MRNSVRQSVCGAPAADPGTGCIISPDRSLARGVYHTLTGSFGATASVTYVELRHAPILTLNWTGQVYELGSVLRQLPKNKFLLYKSTNSAGQLTGRISDKMSMEQWHIFHGNALAQHNLLLK
ncbi:hypothetical protein CBL_03171 [Carabus blaptoides fortunei]